jgi:hypothetical protein
MDGMNSTTTTIRLRNVNVILIGLNYFLSILHSDWLSA